MPLSARPTTLKALRASGWVSRPVKHEIRENFLRMLQNGEELSPAVTFITGPSRTADIELTLTIGVHGPQELYVIINQPN